MQILVGNQFVWIPCTINGANNTLKYDRYVFTRETPTWEYSQSLVLGENGEYETDADGSYKISGEYCEEEYFHEARSEVERASVERYGGFYIGRYEVGCENKRTENADTTEVAKIKSGLNVYDYVTRDEAVTIAERMYEGNSKLCSSYAWDTVLQFIGGTYAVNSEGDSYEKYNLENTGYHEEKNIYDMGGNIMEWTTETYTLTSGPCVIRRWLL